MHIIPTIFKCQEKVECFFQHGGFTGLGNILNFKTVSRYFDFIFLLLQAKICSQNNLKTTVAYSQYERFIMINPFEMFLPGCRPAVCLARQNVDGLCREISLFSGSLGSSGTPAGIQHCLAGRVFVQKNQISAIKVQE